MKKIVSVTQSDIQNGRKCNGRECPVGRATQRTFPDKDVLYAYSYGIKIDNNLVKFPKKTEARILEFIADFDAGEPVKPFRFMVNI